MSNDNPRYFKATDQTVYSWKLVYKYSDKHTRLRYVLRDTHVVRAEVRGKLLTSGENMPNENGKRKQKAAKTAKIVAETESFDFCNESSEPDIPAPTDEAPANKARKRPATSFPNDSDNDSDSQEVMLQATTGQSNEEMQMNSLMTSFGADVSKTLTAKRKRLAGFTSTAMKTSNKRYDEIFAQQQTQRHKMLSEYGKQVGDVFAQWDSDMSKSKEADEKVEGIIRQLQKSLQQQRVVQNQRLLSLKNLHEHFMKTTRELSDIHKEQQSNIHDTLKKELNALQKKMIDDARQEEMANVRKSLQTMLAQV